MERLRGRGIIVTGATGIAAASARRLAGEGAVLVVVSRTEAHCRELVDEIAAAGGRASYVVADLTDARAAADAALRGHRAPGPRRRAPQRGWRLGSTPG